MAAWLLVAELVPDEAEYPGGFWMSKPRTAFVVVPAAEAMEVAAAGFMIGYSRVFPSAAVTGLLRSVKTP